MKREIIKTVIERLFSITARGAGETTKTLDTTKLSQTAYEQFINQIEKTYGVSISTKQRLTCNQLTDVCYKCCRDATLKKVKQLINEYDIVANEIFNSESVSIH